LLLSGRIRNPSRRPRHKGDHVLNARGVPGGPQRLERRSKPPARHFREMQVIDFTVIARRNTHLLSYASRTVTVRWILIGYSRLSRTEKKVVIGTLPQPRRTDARFALWTVADWLRAIERSKH